MCKSTKKLDRFVRRFKQGDLGYCAHRLRKFNYRRSDAIQAAKTVIRECDSTDFDDCDGCELISQVLSLKDEMFSRGLIGRPEYANFILQCGRSEHRQQLIDEIIDDFAKLLKGDTSFDLIAIDDDCHTKNDFLDCHFTSKDELCNWLMELNEDRGPLDVEITDGRNLQSSDAGDDLRVGWIHSRVAVVRDAGKNRKVLFVALLGDDLTDALIKTIWLSTNNRLWNLDFENPKYKDAEPKSATDSDSPAAAAEADLANNIRSMGTCRPSRANELAKAVAVWDTDRTDRSFSVAVWGIGVDAVFGKTVFVPASLAADGTIKAMGPIDGNGNRFYVCHIDLPDKTRQNDTAYTEVALADLLKTVLSDVQAVGLAIHLNDIRLLVGRPQLEDLSAKVGIQFDKEDGNAEEEM